MGLCAKCGNESVMSGQWTASYYLLNNPNFSNSAVNDNYPKFDYSVPVNVFVSQEKVSGR
jgi:hypothetical protein